MRLTKNRNLIMTFFFATFFCVQSIAQTAVESWGQLRIKGTDIVNESGTAVQLQGMSLFWSQWEPDFYEYNTLKWLRDDWCNNIVRAACGVEDGLDGWGTPGAPANGMNYQLDKARTVANAAIDLNMYVLIDWHAHNAPRNIENAKTFFRTIAQEYEDKPNIIYEIFNEPVRAFPGAPEYTWSEIKQYSEVIIAEIRKYDPDNIIVVGTPSFSAKPNDVVGNAINQPNIAYTLHYYAASHFQDYRNRANTARSNGLCVFVTEYGLVNYLGKGDVNESSSNEWWNWMKDNKISHCNWSMCDKDEGASALKPGTKTGGFWNADQLTWSGRLVRNWCRNNCPSYPPRKPITTDLPGKLEAETYVKMAGVQKENTLDVGGGQNLGFLDADDWMEYSVNVIGDGTYEFDFRIASKTGGKFDLYMDGSKIESFVVPITGDWQKWDNVKKSIPLKAGKQVLKIQVTQGGWNFNYINATASGIKDCNGDIDGTARIDNCNTCSGGKTGIAIDVCNGGCLPGFSSIGVKDDFSTETDPALSTGEGVYTWGEEKLEGDKNPEFQALIARNTTKKALEVKITQGQAQYIPFGFSFGDKPVVNTIDLTKNSTYEFILKNTSATSDVNIALAIQDAKGNNLNTLATAKGKLFADAWMYSIAGTVKAGATFILKGDFKDCFYSNYTTKQYEQLFDYSKVATILLTVTNVKNTGAPDYEPLPLKDATIEVEEFKLGDCSNAKNENTPNGILDETYSQPISLFPNPAQSVVTLSKQIPWVLTDIFGTPLISGDNQTINIESLAYGIYVIKTKISILKFIKN